MKRMILVVTCFLLGGMFTLLGRSLLEGQNWLDLRKVAPPQPRPLPKEWASYRDVVKKVLPAVVSLEAQAKGVRTRSARVERSSLPDDLRYLKTPLRDGDEDAVAELIDDDRAQVGYGSGFLISPKGVIVTNFHVVDGADQVLVQMSNGKKFTARTIRTDSKTDLAILQLDVKESLPYLEFGDSEEMAIGDRVLAVGAPFGLAGTVTSGIISSKGRALRMNMYEDFLQTDAAINPGNSGGPLVNLDGKVIGITSAIKSRTGGFQGIGLAIASNLGKEIVAKLLKDGVVQRGYLGVWIRDVDAELTRTLKLPQSGGVMVTRTPQDTPGAKAGLVKGDIILTLAGKPIKDTRELQSVVAGLPIGKLAEIEVIREGKAIKLKVSIEAQPETLTTPRKSIRLPESGQGTVSVDKLGLVVTDLSDDLSDQLGYPTNVRGVLITKVNPQSLAGQAGLVQGHVILSVNRKAVMNARALKIAVNDSSTTSGIVLRICGPSTAPQTITLRDGE